MTPTGEAGKPSLLRRLVRYGLSPVGVFMCGMALYLGYCERQTRATFARLEELGVLVYPLAPRPHGWWPALANATGASPGQFMPPLQTYDIIIYRSGHIREALHLVARLPNVTSLRVIRQPDCDDAALVS